MAISVNIFNWRVTIDCQPRSKNGQPPQSTTGVAKANCSQAQAVDDKNACNSRPGIISPIDRITIGSDNARQTQNRRVMSTSSGFGPWSAVTVIGSKAM